MSEETPYQSPDSELITQEEEFAEIELFSLGQRIGRVRLLAYGFISYLVVSMGLGLLSMLIVHLFSLVNSAAMGKVVQGVILAPILLVLVIVIRRRLHDLNTTSWLILLVFVPLVNVLFGLFLLFAPGTKGPNKYGLPPKPNTLSTWIAGLAFPIIMVLVIASIAMPFYLSNV